MGKLIGKLLRLERAAGAGRLATSRLATRDGRLAVEVSRAAAEATDALPEVRVLLRAEADRAALADAALYCGTAPPGLAPAYVEALSRWSARLDGWAGDAVRLALAADGLLDWSREERFWVWPPDGSERAEALRRLLDELPGDELVGYVSERLGRGWELTDERRRADAVDEIDFALARRLEELRRKRAEDDDSDG